MQEVKFTWRVGGNGSFRSCGSGSTEIVEELNAYWTIGLNYFYTLLYKFSVLNQFSLVSLKLELNYCVLMHYCQI